MILVAVFAALSFTREPIIQISNIMDVQVSTEEGFTDVALPVKTVQTVGSDMHITLEGIYKSENVGLEVVFPAGMKPGLARDGKNIKITHTYQAKLLPTGVQSDTFLKMLAELYGVPSSGKFAIKGVPFTLIPLELNEFDIKKQPVKTKIFFEQPIKYYSELFLNFDIANGYLQFSEKDQEYRKMIPPMLQGEQ